jgi:HEAT repeat protein
MSDRRWYFVRNIVLILGSTRQPAILPYLQRTLRHPEPRVRRETIRALAGVGDARAVEMLVAALEDEDAQNVQLAARYLGMTEVTTAIPQLALVARGEGRGNRDVGPRVEAIEALGKIGSVDALPTLRGLVGRRGLIGGGRNKELKAAAEGAINRIERGGAS